MLGFYMTHSSDCDIALMDIVIASIIMIILTWLSYSSDYALDYDIAMIMSWIILWILQSLGLWIVILHRRCIGDICYLVLIRCHRTELASAATFAFMGRPWLSLTL